jgi:uncharacterized protein YjdB
MKKINVTKWVSISLFFLMLFQIAVVPVDAIGLKSVSKGKPSITKLKPIGSKVGVPSKQQGKQPSTYVDGIVSNEYIAYRVDDNVGSGNYGRFTIGTTGGNPDSPNDDNSLLLYGHPYPGTSYTTIRQDDQSYYYTPDTQAPVVNETELSNTSEATVNNVSYKQIVTIKKNTSTNRDDTVEIKYVVKNNDSIAHNSGLRIMMDTMLGNYDDAAFRVPNVGEVTTETEFSGSAIPQNWQAFDTLINPSVISEGTFFTNTTRKPDKVQFTSWYGVRNTSWDYQITPGASNGDSAVSVYWNPSSLAPGQSVEYVTYYGLSNFTPSDTPTPGLDLALTGPSVIDLSPTGYSPNPFIITSYLRNSGTSDTTNVVASLGTLPDGVRLSPGYTQNVQVGTIPVGTERQISWQVEIDPRSVERNVSYSVTVGGDGVESQTATRNLSIPAWSGPLTAITLDSSAYNLTAGTTHQTVVTARYQDSSTQNVTSTATYQSSNPSVATVNAAGVVTAVASGQTTITATYQGKTATAIVTVPSQATLTSIFLNSSTLKLGIGKTYTTTVTGKYSDGTTRPITSGATFQSSNTSVATVSTSGVITGIKAGKAKINVTYSGKTATIQITVAEMPKLSSISLNTPIINVTRNGTKSMVVTARYADGTTQNVTALATYQSSRTTIATVSSTGIVRGVAVGTADITVAFGGKTVKARVRVTN